MSVSKVQTKMVRLGGYIEELDIRNSDNKIKKVKSVSVSKEFKETNAKVDKNNLHGYKLVPPNHISYVQTTKNEKCFANALNTSDETYVVTQVNKVFFVKNPKVLSIEYLSLILKGDEFDRYAIFNSWGSARETFDWSVLCDTQIPLPDIETQQELVDTYNGLKALAEQNEALIEPLIQACQAYIVDCKKKYPEVELGEYIEEYDVRNTNGDYGLENLRGISIHKKFIPTKANMDNVSLNKYKIVKNNMFAFNVNTARMGEKFAIALCKNDTYLVSSIYGVFKICDVTIILPEYLFMIFKRDEFDRYVRCNSWGSARETFTYSEVCEVFISLPPIEVQQAIVNLYNCAEEAKKIANEAREKMKILCPALVQKVSKLTKAVGI